MSDATCDDWDDASEIHCLIIFKKLFVEDFPHGKQIEYCRELSKRIPISAERLSHRVSSYKAAAGMNANTEASANTVRLYRKYRHTSIKDLETIVSRL